MNHERTRLITVLENMYDSNNRQLGNISNALIESNNNIRNAIHQILNNPTYDIITSAAFISSINRNSFNNVNNNVDSLQNSQFNEIFQSFLQPVSILPTTEQIEYATRIVRYSDIIRPNNTSCPISLEPFQDNDLVSIIRYCNHIFNMNELRIWFQSNCRCPVCRFDIRNYNLQANIINNDTNNIYNTQNNSNLDYDNDYNNNNNNNNHSTTGSF